MFCTTCGKMLPDHARFCNSCGSRVPQTPKPATSEKKYSESLSMDSWGESSDQTTYDHTNNVRCTNCQTSFPRDMRFCPTCGQPYHDRILYQSDHHPGSRPHRPSPSYPQPSYSQPSCPPPLPQAAPPAHRAKKKSLLGTIGGGIVGGIVGAGAAAYGAAEAVSGAIKHKKTRKTTSEANAPADTAETSPVSFTFMAPDAFEPGHYTPIKLFMFDEAFRYIIDGERARMGGQTVEDSIVRSEIPVGSLITVQLTNTEGIVFDEDRLEFIWNGQYLIFPFSAKLPQDFAGDNICINAKIYINHILCVKLQILPSVKCDCKQKIDCTRKNIETAFMSYSHEDITEVILIRDTIKKIAPKMNIFFDKFHITSGKKWEDEIYSQIDKSDVMYLCWSQNAKKSAEVEKEWRYALDNYGLDIIDPIPLQVSDECPPPPELKQLHFNEISMYVRKYYENKEARPPFTR